MEKKLFRMPNHSADRALLLKLAEDVLEHGDFPSNYTAEDLIGMENPELVLSREQQDIYDQFNKLIDVLMENKKVD